MGTELQKTTETATEPQLPTLNVPPDLAFLVNKQLFEHVYRVAAGYSRTQLVPTHFQGKPDDCFVACQLAMRLGVDPFMLMQGLYVVHGKPGMEAKLAIALANAKGAFRDRIKFRLEGEGPTRRCTAYAHDNDTGEALEQTVTMAMAKAEGWLDKPGSKWKTLPDLMLQYRSAAFLIRLTCPEVLMGLQTREEVDDLLPNYGPGNVIDVAPQTALQAALSRPAATEPAETVAEPETEPQEQQTVPDAVADTLEQYRDYFATQAETMKAVSEAVGKAELNPDLAPHMPQIRLWAKQANDRIRGRRGERSNSLLPEAGGRSAAEQ
jgi:hypothetical protein